jgi:uncharacterized protein YdeI (YjbR/CyaY-like superfamily)
MPAALGLPQQGAIMGKKDPRVDAYIAKSADFARPILKHIRKVVHAGCPDVEETLRWGAPHFMHKGMLCGMSSFKAHCAFGFWKGQLLTDVSKGRAAAEPAMGQFGRITAISDLPSERTLLQYVKKAAALNDQGVKVPRRTKPVRNRAVEVPDYFMKALRKNKKALSAFDAFSPSHKREYVEWATEAKGEDTRQRRMETAVEWMAEGKPRHWKYAKK